MSPRPKNSTPEKTAESRQNILESAMETFAERGFDGANMRQIASHAGVNKYMLYYHFEDKKTLFEQVLQTVTGPIFARLGAAIGDAGDLEDALGNVYDIYSDLLTRQNGRVRAFMAREIASGAPRIGPVFRVKGPEIIKLWEPKICAHVGRAELPYQELVRVGVFMLSSIVGPFFMGPILQNIYDVYGLNLGDSEHKTHLIQSILAGVETQFGVPGDLIKENS